MTDHVSAWTRRSLVGAGLSMSLTSTGRAAMPALPDVIVVGAGLAGLKAALDLQAAGANVVVLEAQDRPGGRLRRESGGGLTLDVGGLQVGPMYARLRALCAAFSIPVRAQTRGFGAIDMAVGNTMIRAADWATSPLNRLAAKEREIAPYLLESRLFSALSPFENTDQWLDPAYAKYDITPQALMRQRGVSDEAIRLINSWMNAPGVNRSSSLHIFRENARAKGKTLADEKAAPPTGEVELGLSQLPAAMAKTLKTPARYGAEVIAIAQDRHGCHVKLRSGETLKAGAVICAAPLHAAKHIAFDPPLPAPQGEAFAKAVYSPITQIHLVPTAPFWDDDGMAPTLYTDGPLERVLAVSGDSGVERMVVWLNGQGAWNADKIAPRTLMAQTLARLAKLRPASAGKLKPAFVYSWGRNRFAGGIRYVMDAGQAVRMGATLDRPHGRVWFAGEHMRREEHGMEAALETGDRAAAMILNL